MGKLQERAEPGETRTDPSSRRALRLRAGVRMTALCFGTEESLLKRQRSLVLSTLHCDRRSRFRFDFVSRIAGSCSMGGVILRLRSGPSASTLSRGSPTLTACHPEAIRMPIPIKGTGGSVISSLRSDLSCKSFLFGRLPYRIPPYKGTPSAAKRSFAAAGAPLARRLRMTGPG